MSLEKLKRLRRAPKTKTPPKTEPELPSERDWREDGVYLVSDKARRYWDTHGIKQARKIANDPKLSIKEKAVKISYIKGGVYGDICDLLNIPKADTVYALIHD